jgi:DNA-binding MurR/RpiR family transcriptional regulator
VTAVSRPEPAGSRPVSVGSRPVSAGSRPVSAESRPEPEVTVAERLQLQLATLTPAERKVARTLMADYPVGGLVPIARLSAAAAVSAPTVVRLVSKLGFGSYADFQQSLKSEVSARLSSPLELHTGRPAGTSQDALSRTEQLLCGGIRSSFARTPPTEFEHAVTLLADQRRGVTLIGGRFSSMLAEYLAAHLRILRGGVRMISAAGADRIGAMLDVGRRDVLVAFDYRRYQHDTVRLAASAKGQGATVILFTDPYLSPLSSHADVILTSSVQSPSVFDALTPALALVEAIVAALIDRLGDLPRTRMARYDALHAGTVDGPREDS